MTLSSSSCLLEIQLNKRDIESIVAYMKCPVSKMFKFPKMLNVKC